MRLVNRRLFLIDTLKALKVFKNHIFMEVLRAQPENIGHFKKHLAIMGIHPSGEPSDTIVSYDAAKAGSYIFKNHDSPVHRY